MFYYPCHCARVRPSWLFSRHFAESEPVRQLKQSCSWLLNISRLNSNPPTLSKRSSWSSVEYWRAGRQYAKEGRLWKNYLIWKQHEMANAVGIQTLSIAAAINYVTSPASHFPHCKLQKEGWKHSNILKDLLDLIRQLETASFITVSEPRLTTAVVVALYPSMRLERGMAALLWFMDNHTREQLNALQMCPCISRWNNRAGLGLIWKASGCTGSSSGSAKMPWSSWISRPRHLRGANLKPGRDSDLLEAQVPSLFLPFRKPSNVDSVEHLRNGSWLPIA